VAGRKIDLSYGFAHILSPAEGLKPETLVEYQICHRSFKHPAQYYFNRAEWENKILD